jgi:hypothetical protein
MNLDEEGKIDENKYFVLNLISKKYNILNCDSLFSSLEQSLSRGENILMNFVNGETYLDSFMFEKLFYFVKDYNFKKDSNFEIVLPKNSTVKELFDLVGFNSGICKEYSSLDEFVRENKFANLNYLNL